MNFFLADSADVFERFQGALEWIVLGITAMTVAVLVWGVVYGVVRFIVTESYRLRGQDCEAPREALRKQVGFYLLFSLELLIAADVIETMAEPTLEHLGILGGVTVMRIVIGLALGRELHELNTGDTNV